MKRINTPFPDNMTTLAQRWLWIAPLAYGYPLGVLCWPNKAIKFMNFIYVTDILLMLAQYWVKVYLVQKINKIVSHFS